MPSLTSGHLKKAVSGIGENHVKCFAAGIHRNYWYERPTPSIKSSLINVYDRSSANDKRHADHLQHVAQQ